jgi:general secretion pathway protein L
VWVAACQKSWLQSWLQALEAAGRPVSRIVPALWPTSTGGGETVHWAHDEGDRVWLATANPLGVRCVPLRENGSSTFGDSSFGNLGPSTDSSTDHLLNGSDPATTQWFADPSITALAEQVCNQRFELMSPSAWLLRCAQSDWNLAQFDLSLSSGARRGHQLRQTLRQWRSAPAWRPARWGLAALVATQLLGLNAAAWHERSSLDTKRQAVRQILQQTFPNVTLVMDAPLQMQRELALLQQASGSLATSDLETMLAALVQVAPGEPVTPRRTALPPRGCSARMTSRPSGPSDSAMVMARPMARRLPSSTPAITCSGVTRSPPAPRPWRPAVDRPARAYPR